MYPLRFASPLKPSALDCMAEQLLAGGIGLFPTDTVYGIGCAADHAKSTRRIYTLKERPRDKPFPVLLAEIEQLDRFEPILSEEHTEFLFRYWPGALTAVIRIKQDHAISADCVREGTVAFRIPDHLQLRTLIRKLGKPLAATSANLSGESEPLSLESVANRLLAGVQFAWDEVIPVSAPVPSTVVDLTGSSPLVLRQGSLILPGLAN